MSFVASICLGSAADSARHRLPATPSAQFTSTMSHRGELKSFEEKEIECSAWVDHAGVIGVTGWTLRVETGELHGEGEKTEWTPRQQWSRTGEHDWIEVVAKI